jgi:SAM-dependent methyltransferase
MASALEGGAKPGSLTKTDVITAYRLFFDREPESEDVIKHHIESSRDLRAFRATILSSAEFQDKFPKVIGLPGHKPQNAPPISVDVEVTPDQLSQMVRLVEGNWEALGRTEPHWSVLTADEFKADSIEATKESFYQSGKASADLMFAAAARCGLAMDDLHTCIELGCGVGRVTTWLAPRFRSVTAVDISRPHLVLGALETRRRGLSNIEFVQCRSPEALDALSKVDVLFSIIALQHNPPPVIAKILDILISKLNKNGIAYFQVPTYSLGYTFNAAEYLSKTRLNGQMEMHVIPQQILFSLFERHACRVLEIREDSWTGSQKIISNSFLIQKN